MNSAIRDELFALVRLGMGLNTPLPDVTSEDCKEILQIAKRHSILPVVHQGLKISRAPDEFFKEADNALAKAVFQVLQQEDAMKRVGNALDSAGIPYIPLKGLILRKLYPRPDMRTSSDIDVLVREEELEHAVREIEQHAGFKAIKHNYHDVSMIDSRVHLELHFSIKENMENIDALLMKAWGYVLPSQNSCRKEFTSEFQLFHVIAHMSYHMVHGGLGIRPFLDLWLLRNKSEYDEKTLRGMCEECNILKFYEKSCSLVNSWMSGVQVDASLKQFEEFCLNGGVFGSSETVMASKQRTKRGISYLWGRVFMSREKLETEYPELKQKPYLLPSRQIKRWSRLLSKEKRTQARQELKDVRELDSKVVESFDELLISLGL